MLLLAVARATLSVLLCYFRHRSVAYFLLIFNSNIIEACFCINVFVLLCRILAHIILYYYWYFYHNIHIKDNSSPLNVKKYILKSLGSESSGYCINRVFEQDEKRFVGTLVINPLVLDYGQNSKNILWISFVNNSGV